MKNSFYRGRTTNVYCCWIINVRQRAEGAEAKYLAEKLWHHPEGSSPGSRFQCFGVRFVVPESWPCLLVKGRVEE